MTNPGHTATDDRAPRAGAFPTTQWSVVLDAGATSEAQSRVALEVLCRRYWYPLYGYARRRGRPHHEAEDCTQGFVLHLLAHDGLSRARAERGRFRTFLLSAFRHFLINEWRHSHAARRGGSADFVPLTDGSADERFAREPRDAGLDPEQAFCRAWALELIDRTAAELRSEYMRDGRGELFDVLSLLLWGRGSATPRAELAERLGLNIHAFDVALCRLRKRFGEHLRAAIAQTVASEADVDAELRDLIAAVANSPAG